MAIAYSGAAWTGTFLGETRAGLVDGLKDALVAAGWSVASGSSGDWKLNSGITPSGHQIRIRLYDPGGTAVCARMRLMNVPETITPAGDMFIRPAAGRVFRVLANPYQFFCLVPGTVEPRSFLAAGIPKLPSFLNPQFVGWAHCNAQSDTDTTARHSFRQSNAGPGTDSVVQATMWGTSGWWHSSSGVGQTTLVVSTEAKGTEDRALVWMDNSRQVYEPLIAWGASSIGDTARIAGQLWDAIVISGDWAMDQIVTFDNRQWWCVYYRQGGWRCTLAVLYPTS